jgi:tyrosyl-tRNA synthetase
MRASRELSAATRTGYGKMNFADVVELAAHFTVQQMMERDMFEKRLTENKPIHLHEFMYPLMQGYDTVAMDVDGEVGGNDQTFNMLAGRTLMREMKGKEKFVLTSKLLADANGKKMGKSEGNMIALADSPEDMFGKVMTWTDGMIVPAFELCTRLSNEEIASIEASIKAGANPRDAKLTLAFEITKTFLGEAAAEQGRAHFERVIQSKERPEEIPEIKPSAYDILTVLVEAGVVKSKSDAKRDIEGGGVRVNEDPIIDFKTEVKPGDVIQKGKRFFVKVL